MSNCRLSAPGYGVRVVSVPRVMHGMRIIPKGQDTTRNARFFYLLKVASSSFSMQVQFRSLREYASFGRFIRNYGQHISNPDSGSISPMIIEIPSIGFLKTAIPTSGITMGDNVRHVVRTMTLSFKGASDPVDFESPLISSYHRAPKDITSAHFYPADRQHGSNVHYGSTVEDIADLADKMGWNEAQVRRQFSGGVW